MSSNDLGKMSVLIGGLLGEGDDDAATSRMVHALARVLGGPCTGGLGGLLERFSAVGLGEQARSWVGVRENLPITADQVHQAIGDEHLTTFAAQLELTPEQAARGLAEVIPAAVNDLTPDGTIPHGVELQHRLDNLLGLKA
jgi:uncharacterized protein YidB (DUF937 family)